MNSPTLKKSFDLEAQGKKFQIKLHEDSDNNCFIARCLKGKRTLAKTGTGEGLLLKFEIRAETEEAVMDQLKVRITSEFGKDYKLMPSKLTAE